MFLFDFFKLGKKHIWYVWLAITIILCALSIFLVIKFSVWFVLIVTVWFLSTVLIAYKTIQFYTRHMKANNKLIEYAKKNNLPIVNLTFQDIEKLKKTGVLKVDGLNEPIIYDNIKGI